ncbi:MAG TPA: TIGR01459 family HAD-type hydrolase [Beijerinckiaceae bacterium]|jgi:HAD superfamily hydrolase (TIGR01459 family)
MQTSSANSASGVPLLSGLSAIASSYDVVLSDIWGVVHNGREHFPRACDALRRFRAQGGVVVLVTNAPRPFPPILKQLDHLGAPRDAFDEIVTSGDVTLNYIAARGRAPLHHIGPERDLTFFDILEEQTGVRPPLVALEEADYVVCTGLFDDAHTPADYARALDVMHARRLDMICANPDLVVHVGDEMLYCAGAIAQAYEDAGGRVLQAGKPFAPIYDRALELAARRRGAPVDPARALAIGDALRTDVRGACDRGLDAVFVTSGIHRDELHPGDGPLDVAAMNALVAQAGVRPVGAIPALVW